MSKLTQQAVEAAITDERYVVLKDSPHETHTVCYLRVHDKATVTGESDCIDPADFDEEKGRQAARRRAIDKLWELEGYRMKVGMA